MSLKQSEIRTTTNQYIYAYDLEKLFDRIQFQDVSWYIVQSRNARKSDKDNIEHLLKEPDPN